MWICQCVQYLVDKFINATLCPFFFGPQRYKVRAKFFMVAQQAIFNFIARNCLELLSAAGVWSI